MEEGDLTPADCPHTLYGTCMCTQAHKIKKIQKHILRQSRNGPPPSGCRRVDAASCALGTYSTAEPGRLVHRPTFHPTYLCLTLYFQSHFFCCWEGIWMRYGTRVEVRQLAGVTSLLPCESQGRTWSHQTKWQMPSTYLTTWASPGAVFQE